MKRLCLVVLLFLFIFTKFAGANPEYYMVGQGDTLWNIASRFGVKVDELVAWNNLQDPSQIQLGQLLRIYIEEVAKTEWNIYEVKAGDTLWSISKNFSIKIEDLMRINKIQDSNNIYIGLRLMIPFAKENLDYVQGPQLPIVDTMYLVHWVSSGESPWSIAYDYGAEINDIYQANGQIINELYVGSEIFVPLTAKGPYFEKYQGVNLTYQVQASETIATIANRYNLPENLLRRINGLGATEVVRAGRRLVMPLNTAMMGKHVLYTTKEGEYLFDIAYEFARAITPLLEANYLTDANKVLAKGLTLIIPMGAGTEGNWTSYEDNLAPRYSF